MDLYFHFKNIILDSYNDFKYFKKDYLYLWVAIQFPVLLIVMPLIYIIMEIAFKIASIDSLTQTTVFELLLNPLGLLVFITALTIALLIVIIEITLYISMLDQHKNGKHFCISIWIHNIKLIGFGLFSLQIIVFLFYFLLFLPIFNIFNISTITSGLYLPHFIINELLKSPHGIIIYWIVLLLGTYINVRIMFTVYQLYVYPNNSLINAIKESIKITKRKVIYIISMILSYILLLSLILLFVQFILLLPVYLSDRFFIVLSPFLASISISLFILILFFVTNFTKIIFVHFIFHIVREKTLFIVSTTKQSYPFLGILALFLYLVSLIFSSYHLLVNPIYNNNTYLIAHRGGDTRKAVENTLSSLRAAESLHADYVEIDVLETKDAQFVVFHDTSLRRLANINVDVRDLTLQELQEVTIRQNGFTDTIPTLEEFIIESKLLDQKLLIEIKQSSTNSKDNIEKIIHILEYYEVEHDYLVQSFSLESLKQIRELNKDIQIGYIIPINIGNLSDYDVDFITVEEFSFNERILNQAHNSDKSVYIWTINEEVLLRRYIRSNVDGIITSKINDASTIIDELNTNATISARIEEIFVDLIN